MTSAEAVQIVRHALPRELPDDVMKAWELVWTRALLADSIEGDLEWYRDELAEAVALLNAPSDRRPLRWGNGKEADREDIYKCVGDGWKKILEALLNKLEPLTAPPLDHWDGTIAQVKEKFGELRFYVGSATPLVHDLIDAATAESLRTCEVCGEEGRLRDDLSWMRTLCDHHHRHLKEIKKP